MNQAAEVHSLTEQSSIVDVRGGTEAKPARSRSDNSPGLKLRTKTSMALRQMLASCATSIMARRSIPH